MNTRVNCQNGRFYPEYQNKDSQWVRYPSCFIADGDHVSFHTEDMAEYFLSDVLGIRKALNAVGIGVDSKTNTK